MTNRAVRRIFQLRSMSDIRPEAKNASERQETRIREDQTVNTTTELRLLFCPECDGAMVPGVRRIKPPMPTYSEAVQQAFRDWNEQRAYIDNGGNYRLRPEPATPTYHPRGKVAPWNREVKRRFASCGEFHAAAKESLKK